MDPKLTEQDFYVQSLEHRAATERRLTAETILQLRRVQKQVEEKGRELARVEGREQLKTEFISMISHELRTPITPIMGYLSFFLSGGLGEISPKQREALLIMRRQSGHLLTLIDSITDAGRTEAGKPLEIKKEPLLMNEIVKQALVGAENQEKKLGIELDLADDLPTVMGDKAKLTRVMANLLGNAVKFTPAGGKIVIKTVPRDGGVQVSVADNGLGLARENLERVFEKFYQVDSSSTRAAGGLGLGLTIAREIIAAHGGRIWVESAGPGRGGEVAFYLPLI